MNETVSEWPSISAFRNIIIDLNAVKKRISVILTATFSIKTTESKLFLG